MKVPTDRHHLLAVAALTVYSVSLLWVEATTSQEHVRRYFTDIGQPYKPGYFAAPTGETIFFAVNTSLSAFLLGCAGVLLMFAALAARKPGSQQACLYIGQAVILLWMALDERFMLHETIGVALRVPSTLILGAAVVLNVALYLTLFRASFFSPRMAYLLVAAALMFFVMMIFDVLLPQTMPLRLSLEDLSKTWAAFALLLFAWEAARFRLVGQPGGERGLKVPAFLASRTPAGWRSRLAS